MDKAPSSPIWELLQFIQLKHFIKEKEDRLPLRHMAEKMIYDKKSGIFQFQFGYMKHPTMKKIGHIENRLSRCFNLHFKEKMKSIKYMLQKNMY